MKITTHSAKETQSLAREVMGKYGSRVKQLTIALTGELGAGKTTFTQAFAKELGVKKRILSPTFLIMKRFPIKKGAFENMYHIDAYRIKEADLKALGIEKILKAKNVVLIEWADKVRKILPKDTIWIKFDHGEKENERQITINRR